MLAEGYRAGSSTLVAGPSGAGKTLMGLHFIFSGAASGGAVIATPAGEPVQLQRMAAGFDWSLDDDRVAVMYRSPNDVYIDEWVYELLDLVEATGARRVLIDSLSDLHYAAIDPVRFREFIYSLTQRLSRAGISPIMTSEVPDLFHVGSLAEYGISHLSDNVVLLQYLRAEPRLLRTVTVIKSRASGRPRSASSTSPRAGSCSGIRSAMAGSSLARLRPANEPRLGPTERRAQLAVLEQRALLGPFRRLVAVCSCDLCAAPAERNRPSGASSR